MKAAVMGWLNLTLIFDYKKVSTPSITENGNPVLSNGFPTLHSEEQLLHVCCYLLQQIM